MFLRPGTQRLEKMIRSLKWLRIVVAFLAAIIRLLYFAPTRTARAANITVTTTDDELNADGDCSLREAIQAANTDAAVDACAAGSGPDTSTPPAGAYTLSIAGAGEDAIATGDLTIYGAPDRAFHILAVLSP